MATDVILPYRTDWRDMEGVLDYCKGKGAERAALEARFGAGESLRETLNALEQLELIERGDSGDVRLSAAGEQLAYAPDRTHRQARLTEALMRYDPYRFPLERALADHAPILDAPWVEHLWQVDMRLGQPRNRVEEARTFFFRLADEAGLGTYRRGVRGQTTRLDLADNLAEMLDPIVRVARSAPPAPVAPSAETTALADADLSPQGYPPVSVALPFGATRAVPAAAGTVINVYADVTNWELDKIERFLQLIAQHPGHS